MTLRRQVQPVLVPEPAVPQHRHRCQVDQHRLEPLGRRPYPHVERVEPGRQPIRRASGAGPLHHGEQDRADSRTGERADRGVVPSEQRRQVRPRPEQVVRPGMERGQVRRELQCDRQLGGDHLVEQPATDGEVRVAERTLAAGQLGGHAVRPSEVPAGRADLVLETFGERIPQRDERTDHPASLPGALRRCDAQARDRMPCKRSVMDEEIRRMGVSASPV
jgi:hypothetical protein